MSHISHGAVGVQLNIADVRAWRLCPAALHLSGAVLPEAARFLIGGETVEYAPVYGDFLLQLFGALENPGRNNRNQLHPGT